MAVPQRLVSLLPGSTEILCALGVASRLVGISQGCDYPEAIVHLPRVTGPPRLSLPLPGAPADADSALVQTGLTSERLDLPLLRRLQPDLIVTQLPDLPGSEVSEVLLAATRRCLGTSVEVLALQPTFLQDIWDAIHLLGAATGHSAQAATLLEELFARVNTLVAASIMLQQPPRVAVLSQCEPLQLAGYWLPDMIQLAGGSAGLSPAGVRGPDIRWEQLLEYAPEVLLVIPREASLVQTRLWLPALQARPGWRDLPAVQQGQVYAVDGRTSLYRPGPRLVDGLELLAGLIHPDLFGEFLETQPQAYCTVSPA